MNCKKCKSSALVCVNQYAVKKSLYGSSVSTDYFDSKEGENFEKRLSEFYPKHIDYRFYLTGNYWTCEQCDHVQTKKIA